MSQPTQAQRTKPPRTINNLPARDLPGMRKCLRCSKMFMSPHCGIRACKTCTIAVSKIVGRTFVEG